MDQLRKDGFVMARDVRGELVLLCTYTPWALSVLQVGTFLCRLLIVVRNRKAERNSLISSSLCFAPRRGEKNCSIFFRSRIYIEVRYG